MHALPAKLAGAALTIAALAVGTSGMAGAATISPSAANSTVTATNPAIAPYATGSANLDKVANALRFYSKSVTTVVRAPAGLALTRPVEIDVAFGDPGFHKIQSYSSAYGNRLSFDFDPGNGALRSEHVTVVLRERDAVTNAIVRSFTIQKSTNVQALWDVFVSGLRMTFWQACDFIDGSAEANIALRDATGSVHYTHIDANLQDTFNITDGFSGTFHEVKASDPIFQPAVSWAESDPFDYNPVPNPPTSGPLLPTEDQLNQMVIEESGGDCSASFSYRVDVTLRQYPGLPNA